MNKISSQGSKEAVENNQHIVKYKEIASSFISKYGVFLVFIFLSLFFSVYTDTFFTKGNILIVLRQISINGIISVGMTFVIIAGGIDFSVGSILAFSSIAACSFAHPGEYAVFIPIVVGLAVGLFCGLFNGLLIAKGNFAPFIVTLVMLRIARGLTDLFSNGRPVINLSPSYNFIGVGHILGIPIPVLLLIVVIIIGACILNLTRFGRCVYAIGANEAAAKVSGINVVAVKTLVYVIAGTLSGLAGIVLSARVNAATLLAGTGCELDVIVAGVIGGTSLSGGKGTIHGPVIVILIMGVLSNGINLMGVAPYYEEIMSGLIELWVLYLIIKKLLRLSSWRNFRKNFPNTP